MLATARWVKDEHFRNAWSSVAAGFFTDGDQMGSKTQRTVAAQLIFLYWDVGLSKWHFINWWIQID